MGIIHILFLSNTSNTLCYILQVLIREIQGLNVFNQNIWMKPWELILIKIYPKKTEGYIQTVKDTKKTYQPQIKNISI